MKFLHTMIRVVDLERSIAFYTEVLGLRLRARNEHEQGRFTLAFLAPPDGGGEIELTYNWDQTEPYPMGKAYGHVAFGVPSFDEIARRLDQHGLSFSWGPKGSMAFVDDPDGYEIELLLRSDS